MSYAILPRKAFGTLDEWTKPSLHSFLPSDVFVLRLGLTGLPLRDARDVLPLLRAAGRGQNLHLDVRGAAVWQDPGAAPDVWHADLVFTTAMALLPFAPLMPGFVDDGLDMAKKIQADPGMAGSFPGWKVVSQLFGQLTLPADAIDHWRSQPILWDHALGPAGQGGPSDTFAKPADFSIVRGKADDGARAVPWKIAQPPLTPPGPSGSSTLLLLAGLALAGLIGFQIVKGQGKRR